LKYFNIYAKIITKFKVTKCFRQFGQCLAKVLMHYAGRLEPAEKAFSYDEYTISLAVKKLTANEIVYSTYENGFFSAGFRHPAALFANLRRP
jgi:hypothetical protein